MSTTIDNFRFFDPTDTDSFRGTDGSDASSFWKTIAAWLAWVLQQICGFAPDTCDAISDFFSGVAFYAKLSLFVALCLFIAFLGIMQCRNSRIRSIRRRNA